MDLVFNIQSLDYHWIFHSDWISINMIGSVGGESRQLALASKSSNWDEVVMAFDLSKHRRQQLRINPQPSAFGDSLLISFADGGWVTPASTGHKLSRRLFLPSFLISLHSVFFFSFRGFDSCSVAVIHCVRYRPFTGGSIYRIPVSNWKLWGGETAEVWPISALTPISRLSYAAQNINQVKEQQQQQRQQQQQQHQQQQQQKYAVGRAWAGGRTRTDVMAANGNGPIQSVKWIQFNVMPLEWSLLSPGFNEPGMSDMGPTCFGFFHHRLRLYAIYWQLFKYLITWRDAAGATAATETATAAWNC